MDAHTTDLPLWGFILATLTLLFGFGLGASFGVFEAEIEKHLKESAYQVLDRVYGGNTEQADSVVEKSWKYFQRAHLHAGGLGAASLGLSLLLCLLPVGKKLQQSVPVALGLGSLGYSVFWLWAGLRAPALGGNQLARESLTWLAWSSVTLIGGGTLVTLAVLVALSFKSRQSSPKIPLH